MKGKKGKGRKSVGSARRVVDHDHVSAGERCDQIATRLQESGYLVGFTDNVVKDGMQLAALHVWQPGEARPRMTLLAKSRADAHVQAAAWLDWVSLRTEKHGQEIESEPSVVREIVDAFVEDATNEGMEESLAEPSATRAFEEMMRFMGEIPEIRNRLSTGRLNAFEIRSIAAFLDKEGRKVINAVGAHLGYTEVEFDALLGSDESGSNQESLLSS